MRVFQTRSKTEFDRLKAVDSSVSGHMQDARYDVNGLRHRKLDKSGNSSDEYGVGIAASASAPSSGSSSAPSISYISGHMIMGAEINGSFVFHLPDALGTTRDVVDDTGAVIKSFEFSEYGDLLSSSGTGTASPKTFVGGLSVNDDTADSGLFNMGHRNFGSNPLGRFVNRDPIGHAGGLNLYAYPTNPVNTVDPSGLNPGMVGPLTNPQPSTRTRQKPLMVRFPIPPGYHPEINKAINQIGQSDPVRAQELRRQLQSGELKFQRSRYNVGFTDPCTSNISIDESHTEAGATPTDDYVRSVSLLFHEAGHATTQYKAELAAVGWEAYAMGNRRSECTLEMPIYKAQHDFLQDWYQQENDPLIRAAIQTEIKSVSRSLNYHAPYDY